MGGEGEYWGSDSQNIWMIQKMREMGYKKGVRNLSNDEINWTHDGEMVIRPTDNGILTTLNSGSSVLTENMTDTMWDFASNPAKFIGQNMPTIPNYVANKSNSGITGNTFTTTLSLPNVFNYNDFINQAKSDPKFENLVQTMSIGASLGNNRLSKYNI